MKIVAGPGVVLFFLCGPALADSGSPGRPDSHEVHFALREAGATRTFTVIVSHDRPCATVSQKLPGHQIELKACVSHDAHLDIEWFTRSRSGEYRSTSSLSLAHGAAVELGSEHGPRLGVKIQ